MRLVAFSVAEICKSMVRAPTWKVNHLEKVITFFSFENGNDYVKLIKSIKPLNQ